MLSVAIHLCVGMCLCLCFLVTISCHILRGLHHTNIRYFSSSETTLYAKLGQIISVCYICFLGGTAYILTKVDQTSTSALAAITQGICPLNP